MADTKKYNLFELAYKEASLERIKNKKSTINQQITECETIARSHNSLYSFVSLELVELRDQEFYAAQSIDSIKRNCNHDLILYLDKDQHKDDNGFSICLECLKPMHIKEPNNENIINVADLLPEKYICTYVNGKNVLAIRARNTLIMLAKTYTEISFDELKQLIIEDLVCYCDELSEIQTNSRRRRKNK